MPIVHVVRACKGSPTGNEPVAVKGRARPIKQVGNMHTDELATPANEIHVTIQEVDGEPFGIGGFPLAQYFWHEAMLERWTSA
jgi:phenylpyruvate tautomerase PptA (4-oxalocrotonate tautomerase family)